MLFLLNFKIFDFEFVEGDRTALSDPLGVVLSEDTAENGIGDAAQGARK